MQLGVRQAAKNGELHLPEPGPVNRSLRCDGRNRLLFRASRRRVDRDQRRHHDHQDDQCEFLCHVRILTLRETLYGAMQENP